MRSKFEMFDLDGDGTIDAIEAKGLVLALMREVSYTDVFCSLTCVATGNVSWKLSLGLASSIEPATHVRLQNTYRCPTDSYCHFKSMS